MPEIVQRNVKFSTDALTRDLAQFESVNEVKLMVSVGITVVNLHSLRFLDAFKLSFLIKLLERHETDTFNFYYIILRVNNMIQLKKLSFPD